MKRRAEARRAAEQAFGSETVYRDKHGKKLDVLEELEKRRKNRKEYDELNEAEEEALRKGKAQREAEEGAAREMARVAGGAFARGADDGHLEALRKETIREGDPMAQRATQKVLAKKHSRMRAEGREIKPEYKGPNPKPNRYGTRPGYRWDGVDRGNGFEDKVLASKVGAQRRKAEMYKNNVADM